ncbi:hypothetical protein GUJ93_ZPchr0013g34336 [Zizania palustris]|uniref:Uncharacterized protein n=1 Tax=Zizania palustris TaxID=103762 RepID=A0A8J5WVU0_ZIZPA|nr:hypothetical protein GUJ93_ZPchr0013g34336 [Zizania palustris]
MQPSTRPRCWHPQSIPLADCLALQRPWHDQLGSLGSHQHFFVHSALSWASPWVGRLFPNRHAPGWARLWVDWCFFDHPAPDRTCRRDEQHLFDHCALDRVLFSGNVRC